MKQKQTYEESIDKLENIVKQLESGDLPLEEALKLFSEGAEITAFCAKALEDAEQKIRSVSDAKIKKEDDTNA